MFVEITNGSVYGRVSKGAFDSYYKSIGFHIVGDDKSSDNTEKDMNESSNSEDVNIEDNNEEDVEDNGNEDNNEEDENVVFVQDIMEKPISQWTPDEMKKFAVIKGIDTSSAKKTSEARNIIKEFLMNEDKNKAIDA